MEDNIGLMFTPSTADFSKVPELLKSMKLVEDETEKLVPKIQEPVFKWLQETELPSGQREEVLLLAIARVIRLYKNGMDNQKNGDKLQI